MVINLNTHTNIQLLTLNADMYYLRSIKHCLVGVVTYNCYNGTLESCARTTTPN